VRRAANENPVVQMALIGALVAVFAFMFYTRVLSGGSEADSATTESSTATTPTVTTPTDTAPAVPGAAAPAAPGTAPGAVPAPTPPSDGTGASGNFESGPGLPEPVAAAYNAGEAVALLIIRQAGIEDKQVKAAVNALRARPDLAVFVTGAKNIARYSQIANGVAVSRVPALIVIRPKALSADVPEASVSYGFRGPESVLQAVDDALYDGRDVPYYPE